MFKRNEEHIYGPTELNSTITSHQSNDENSSNPFSQYQQSPLIARIPPEGQMVYPHDSYYLNKYLGYDSSFYREHSVSSNKSRSSISSSSTQKSSNRKYIHKRHDSDLSYLIQNAYSMSRDK